MLLFFCLLCTLTLGFTISAYASEYDEVVTSEFTGYSYENEGTTIVPFSDRTLGSKTIYANSYGLFADNGAYYKAGGGASNKFTVNFSSSVSVEIGFYVPSTDTYHSVYSGTTSSRTINFSPTYTVQGCFYVKNKTSGTIYATSSYMTN